MDGARFDNLVAQIAGRSSRRVMAQALIGAGVGLAVPAAAEAKHRKRHHRRCANNLDCPGTQTCDTNDDGKRVCTPNKCAKPNTHCKSAEFFGCCTTDNPVCCAGTQLATCNAAGCGACDALGFCHH
ncbi:MAG TPA: hypothetical protein VFQ80_05375 [Thermomicrobiales bacterium]|jgi:hypothetical protein|nr:hypothetical protein [Thermomicrobiales bacterium]